PGSTPASVFAGLGNRGVIQRAAWVRRYWQWRMPDTILQAGEYRLEPGMQVRGLLGALQRGGVASRSITLVEGWTFSQFRAAPARAERLQQTLPRDWATSRWRRSLSCPSPIPRGCSFPIPTFTPWA